MSIGNSIGNCRGVDNPEFMQRFPYAAAAIGYVRKTFLKNSLEFLLESEDDYVGRLDRTIRVLLKARGGRDDKLEEILDAVLEYTSIFIKEQIIFQRSGRYRQSSFAEVQEAVYDNRELMENMYLPGLYLTQVFWPIHYHLGKEFRRLMLPRLENCFDYLEAGVGPGHTLLEVLLACPGIRAAAVDISAHSLEFAGRLLRAEGVDYDRVRFLQQDLADEFCLEPRASAGTMGEVLEHIEKPDRALINLAESLFPESPVFITTVINSSAIDHITQFTSCQEIDELIANNGFHILERNTISPNDFGMDSKKTDTTQIYYGLFQKY